MPPSINYTKDGIAVTGLDLCLKTTHVSLLGLIFHMNQLIVQRLISNHQRTINLRLVCHFQNQPHRPQE